MATPAELIAQIYIGFYDRAPDPTGLQYWIGRLAAGVSTADIGDSFAASPEAQETYPYLKFPDLLSPDDFLGQVYQNVFGRAIDADGLAYYKARLESGESAGSVVYSILGNASTNEGSPDQVYLQNKVDAGLYWSNEAATSGVNIYDEEGRLTDAANNSAHGVIDGVTADPATVDEAKGEADDFFSATPHDLTKEIDHLIGSSGNDAYSGTASAGGLSILDSTLNSGDSIDGGGGDDSLTIVSTLGAGPVLPVVPKLTSVETVNTQVVGGGGQFVLDLGTSTGVKTVGIFNSNNTAAGYINVANLVDGTSSNVHDGGLFIQYSPALLTGASDTQKIALTNSSLQFGAGDVNGDGIENLVVTTTGSDPIYEENELYYAANGLKTATISGDGPLYIDFSNDNSKLVTVDASGTTGGVYVDYLNNANDVTVTGGSGDDIFWFYDKLTKTDVVNGGDGFDAVGVDAADFSSAAGAAAFNALTSIEQIRFYDNGANVAVNGATLTNASITSLMTYGNFNDFDVTNARDAWSYTFRDDTQNSHITLTDQATTFNITLSGDNGLQHVTGDGDAAYVGYLELNLSGVAPASAVATVNLTSSGDLAAGAYNEVGNLVVKVGSTINVTGNAALHLDAINAATTGQHVTVDASAHTGGLTVFGTDQANGAAAGDGLAVGDVIKLGSGSDTVQIDVNSSGFTDFDTGDLKTDTVSGFQAGAAGDVLDHLGADYTYTAMSATGQAAIDALGSGTTLQIAADTATANITATTEWTAFTFQGHTYALFNGDGNATFDTGVDSLVELVGVHVADLTGANFA